MSCSRAVAQMDGAPFYSRALMLIHICRWLKLSLFSSCSKLHVIPQFISSISYSVACCELFHRHYAVIQFPLGRLRVCALSAHVLTFQWLSEMHKMPVRQVGPETRNVAGRLSDM